MTFLPRRECENQNGIEDMKPRVGIDFGGVITRNRKLFLGEDTELIQSQGEEVAQPGVFEAIRDIVSFCDGHVWIVSKGGPYIRRMTNEWLERVDFFSRTGMARDRVRFCRERQEKEPICREMEITHFVDDRVHVMQILRYTVPHLYFFQDPANKRHCPPWATFVSNWTDFSELMIGDTRKIL
jgi:hypothetical protein